MTSESTIIETSAGEKNNLNAHASAMTIVRRHEIPSITSVTIEGQEHNLGIVKDFRKNSILSEFLPEKPERISFSWVRLLSSETLAVHSHPTSSIIIVCEGEGYCTGDISGYLNVGSIVVVPPHCLHGFCGAGEHGFWGLSIQLESLGLYEKIDLPRVNFDGIANKSDNLSLLLQAHDFFLSDFKRNPFFSLLESDAIQQPNILDKFLDNIQYFSTRFQDILKVRLNNAQSKIEYDLANEHLEEERDHDLNFSRYRGNPIITDIHKELAEISDWFELSMLTSDDCEKIVLMHFVLEGSGQLAHSAVYSRVHHLPVAEHFAIHQEEDEEHFLMGVNALETMKNLNMEKLLTVLITGWSKLNKLCACMANSAYPQLQSKTDDSLK